MRSALFTLFLVLISTALRADTVEIKPDPDESEPNKDGLKLEGKVHRETDEFIFFMVDEEKGTVRIPKSKIKSIEYDINTQTEKLKPDDFAGHYKVGVWAMDKAMYAEAVQIFEALKGKEGPGPDMLKLLGKAYENRQQMDKALENYTDYLKLNPQDAEVTAKVTELNKVVNPDAGNTAPGEKAKPKVVDGLEGDGTWVSENWGITAKVQFSAEPTTGNKTIAIQTEGGDKDKVAVSRTGQPLDLSDTKEMFVRVFHNSQQPVALAIGFVNAQGEFHESKQMRVPANSWNNVTLRIDGKGFKAARNNFKDFDLEMEGKQNIKRIIFLVYTQKPLTMYLDGIFFK
ncbi:MAG TPA: tetratricopeptide repeat protein [Planctomycetota bacterium]|nr:tetratricopeptide repeat protein [Planctomycetota bacterium]